MRAISLTELVLGDRVTAAGFFSQYPCAMEMKIKTQKQQSSKLKGRLRLDCMAGNERGFDEIALRVHSLVQIT